MADSRTRLALLSPHKVEADQADAFAEAVQAACAAGDVAAVILRLDPSEGPAGEPARALLSGRNATARESLRRQRAAKALAFELKATLAAPRGWRRPGEPAVPVRQA